MICDKIVNRINREYKKMLKRRIVCAPYKYGLNRSEKREKLIIVSMTTFPQRFINLHICLKSLLFQTIKPDKIIVWLDIFVKRSQFTSQMNEIEKYGVEFRFEEGDLKPHKKYIHAMRLYPDDIVITVDDDTIYTPYLVESLLKSYMEHPKAISARRVHRITFNGKKVNPYSEWEFQYHKSTKERMDLFACGIGGVLYPPHLLPEETFDYDVITEKSLKNDDIWLKFMETRNNIPVVWTKCYTIHPPVVDGTQEIALQKNNRILGMNDNYIIELTKDYPDVMLKIRSFLTGSI